MIRHILRCIGDTLQLLGPVVIIILVIMVFTSSGCTYKRGFTEYHVEMSDG